VAAQRFRASQAAAGPRVRTPRGRWMPAGYLARLAERLVAPGWQAKREASGRTRRKPRPPQSPASILGEIRALRQRCALALKTTAAGVAERVTAMEATARRWCRP
jgi:hypothetical protein